VPDNGVPDNGVPDNGVPDNGVPDNGVPDNGVPDNGVPGNGVGNHTVAASSTAGSSAAAGHTAAGGNAAATAGAPARAASDAVASTGGAATGTDASASTATGTGRATRADAGKSAATGAGSSAATGTGRSHRADAGSGSAGGTRRATRANAGAGAEAGTGRATGTDAGNSTTAGTSRAAGTDAGNSATVGTSRATDAGNGTTAGTSPATGTGNSTTVGASRTAGTDAGNGTAAGASRATGTDAGNGTAAGTGTVAGSGAAAPARTPKPLPAIRQAPTPEPVEEPGKAEKAADEAESSEESELEERRRQDRLALRRAEIRLAQGDAHAALAEASPAMARLASDADVWLLMARIRIALDDIPGALRATETASALRPGAPAISAVVSDALAASGRHAEAIAAARAALEAEPGNPHWQHLVATRLVEAGKDRAEADKLARAAVAAMPDEPAFQATAVLTQGSRHRRGRGGAEPEVSTETALVPFRTAGASKPDAGEDAPARRWAWGRGTGRALALPAGPSAAKAADGEPLVDFVESLKSDVPVVPGNDGVTVLEGETVPEGKAAYRPPRPMPKLVTQDPGDKPWQRGGPASMTGTMRPGGPDWSALAGTRPWQQGTGAIPVVSSGAADARWPMARVGVTTALGAGATYACLVLQLTDTARLAGVITLVLIALMVIQFVWSSGAAGRRALGRALNTVRRVLAAVLGLGAVVTLGLAAAGADGRMPWLLAGAAAAGLLAAVFAATEPRSRRRTHGQR
ncbi:hypothetical protein ACH45F_16985, partial [Catenuloplanes sp. NPDC020197]|uniref:hypothetical protein n=1 Tax=Catenuloplanes sp. NPDC020197 TaxID=3363958 RepID=UPI0037ACDD53